jgi:hypothetical protein
MIRQALLDGAWRAPPPGARLLEALARPIAPQPPSRSARIGIWRPIKRIDIRNRRVVWQIGFLPGSLGECPFPGFIGGEIPVSCKKPEGKEKPWIVDHF